MPALAKLTEATVGVAAQRIVLVPKRVAQNFLLRLRKDSMATY